jgi:hypothetical protein
LVSLRFAFNSLLELFGTLFLTSFFLLSLAERWTRVACHEASTFVYITGGRQSAKCEAEPNAIFKTQ